MKSLLFHTTGIGRLAIVGNDKFITNLYFANETLPDNLKEEKNPLLEEAAVQLDEYLAGNRRYFTLPLKPEGTFFRQKVWDYLLKIPYGKLVTYKDIAVDIGNPQAYRAVALACKNNPVPIFIPCHRVIKSDGKREGYKAGYDVKKKLIALEWQNIL